MIIRHKYVTNVSADEVNTLARLGVSVTAGFVVFEVDEVEPNWPDVAAFARAKNAADSVRTIWSKSEIETATWLSLMPTWHHGYPQPEDSYWEMTYADEERCRACGIRGLQRAPFRMRGEPKWGRRWVMQLNWEFDEYFVRRDIWDSHFAPIGMQRREVLDAKSDRELETVVQWDTSNAELVSLAMEGLATKYCVRCERPKHLPFTRGCLPSFAGASGRAGPVVVKSRQWFGDGGSAFRAVLISQDLRLALGADKVHGWSYHRVCEGDQ